MCTSLKSEAVVGYVKSFQLTRNKNIVLIIQLTSVNAVVVIHMVKWAIIFYEDMKDRKGRT